MVDFWNRVDIRSDDQCWEWQAQLKKDGYGVFWMNNTEWRAHRLVMHDLGHDITQKVVCHTCDNPKCVNPDHLFVGTQKENIADCIRKNRKPCGSKIINSKLTDQDVKDIRSEYAQHNITQRELAEKYHVSHVCIHQVIVRKQWKHVA